LIPAALIAGLPASLTDRLVVQIQRRHYVTYNALHPQTSKNRLTAPPSVLAPPAILSSRDCSIAGYS